MQIPLSIFNYCVVISSVYFYAVYIVRLHLDSISDRKNLASNPPSAYSVIPYYRICAWPVIVTVIFVIPQQFNFILQNTIMKYPHCIIRLQPKHMQYVNNIITIHMIIPFGISTQVTKKKKYYNFIIQLHTNYFT